MTPKEKAQQLFDSMFDMMPHPSTTNAETYIISKRCAIVAVDEILYEFHMHDYSDYMEHRFQYFRQVKQEIERL